MSEFNGDSGTVFNNGTYLGVICIEMRINVCAITAFLTHTCVQLGHTCAISMRFALRYVDACD